MRRTEGRLTPPLAPLGARGVDAIEHERVEVEVQIERVPEARAPRGAPGRRDGRPCRPCAGPHTRDRSRVPCRKRRRGDRGRRPRSARARSRGRGCRTRGSGTARARRSAERGARAPGRGPGRSRAARVPPSRARALPGGAGRRPTSRSGAEGRERKAWREARGPPRPGAASRVPFASGLPARPGASAVARGGPRFTRSESLVVHGPPAFAGLPGLERAFISGRVT